MSGYYGTLDPRIISVPVQQSYDPYNLYGYNLLYDIYGNILDTLNKYPTDNLKIKSNTVQNIQKKFEKLKSLEQEIKEALQNEEIKRKLQIASRGQIDPYRIPDDKDKILALLQKHSNLLGLTTTYNSKVMNLSNMLQRINDVLVDRHGDPKYRLNVSVNYPNYSPVPGVPWTRYS